MDSKVKPKTASPARRKAGSGKPRAAGKKGRGKKRRRKKRGRRPSDASSASDSDEVEEVEEGDESRRRARAKAAEMMRESLSADLRKALEATKDEPGMGNVVLGGRRPEAELAEDEAAAAAAGSLSPRCTCVMRAFKGEEVKAHSCRMQFSRDFLSSVRSTPKASWTRDVVRAKVFEVSARRLSDLGPADKHYMGRTKAEGELARYTALLERLDEDTDELELAELYSRRSTLTAALGDFEQSLLDAELCISLRPSYAAAHFRRGCALYALGRHGEASQAFMAGLRVAPGSTHLRNGFRLSMREIRSSSLQRPASPGRRAATVGDGG